MDRVEEIQRLLPHRDPFLFVDRLVEIDAGERVVGVHDVPEDAFWVPGHFPSEAVMPGVLIAEALAQTAALVYLTGNPEKGGEPVFLVGMDKMRFRKPVRPGATLRLEVRVADARRRLWTFDGEASVDGVRVANGSFLATMT